MNTKRAIDDHESADNARLPWLFGAMAVLAIPVTLLWWPGCKQYPEASSKESIQLMKMLYTACNTRDSNRLAKVEARLHKAEADGKVSAAEAAAFYGIIDAAKKGNWEQAEHASFKFAQDQLR